ncbi:lipocalin-like domain-containing protein, partial [Bradyrhizobium sp. SUTN9-2]|uniref:lipocalin-like domain-containing protein n=1 Tax=Bradyrhizobium sp. SUTN9-2 TaxID=1167456 RepID=UPI000D64925A
MKYGSYLAKFALCSICFALPSFPQELRANDDLKQKLVGVWKLESFVTESVETKERRYTQGEKPNGYLIITPERLMTVITGQGRKAAQTDEERVALFRTLFAYTGTYKVEGDRLTTKVEVSWNESWVGTDQT